MRVSFNGRYLLVIQSTAGSAIDPGEDALQLRKNWGVMASYEHHWAEGLRSTAMAGYAKSKPLDWQADDTFESSTYSAVNVKHDGVVNQKDFGKTSEKLEARSK